MGTMYVKSEDRPDLAAFATMSQADIRGYAFSKVFPLIHVQERSGTMKVVAPGLTNAQGTANRTDGTALSGGAITMLDVSYATGRIEGRAKIYENEMHEYADMDAACQAGAENAGRLALNKIEAVAMGEIFSSARKGSSDANVITLANHAVLTNLQKAAKKVRKWGKAVLVCSDAAFLKFCEIPEVAARLVAYAKVSGDVGYLALNDPAVLQTVSTLLHFHGIAIYDSDIVGTTNDGYMAVVGVRPDAFGGGDAGRNAAKRSAMFGGMFVAIPKDGTQDNPFTMHLSANEDDKYNRFDAEGWLIAKPFSTITSDDVYAGAAIVKFAAEYTGLQEVVVNAPAQTGEEQSE